MNIKSFLLGSAAALVAVSGARAADAVVVAEPEPVEYVRVCDVYGAGFFYIPGTETCLKIGGYVRYQMNYNNRDWTETNVGPHSYRFWKLARFAPTFDVRSGTEWGTLRAFAEVEFDWNSYTWDGAVGTGAAQSTNLYQAYIELQTGTGSFLIGKTDNPFARFLDYGDAAGPLEGDYGGQLFNSGEISYTFNPGNGFSGVIAVVEAQTGLFQPNVEVGAKFSRDWGSFGAVVGYDGPNNAWGVKGVARVAFDPVSLGVHVLYSSSEAGVYGAAHPFSGFTSRWSVLAHASIKATEKVSVLGHFQWFDRTLTGGVMPGTWRAMGGLSIDPVADLNIRPEVRYTHGVGGNDSIWEGALRITRYF
ncbi:Porin Omp2b [Rhizobiaceae bacterium]|nr:Porin Omp2b [Rhizobiaceae bacterium]